MSHIVDAMPWVSAHMTVERSNAVIARDVAIATVSATNATKATSPAVARIRVALRGKPWLGVIPTALVEAALLP